jgi:tRNA threonylcarbamoyladenosine biosynthesis protein TsaE
MEYTTTSPEETQKVAAALVEQLHGGDILALEGDLGGGKTTFVQGIAQALGYSGPATSPTFTIMNLYPLADHPRDIHQICHVDFYRLKNTEDLENVGIMDYLGDPKTLMVIEWAQRAAEILPPQTRHIQFHFDSIDQRVITISSESSQK